MPMRLRYSNFGAWAGLATAIAALASSGCGSGDFVPPPPPELRGLVGGNAPGLGTGSVPATTELLGSTPVGIRSIELVLSGNADTDVIEDEKSAARSQAGQDKARIRISVSGQAPPGSPNAPAPNDQAKLVREAVERHPLVLIVEPADPADRDLAQAIREARAAKLPVVIVGRPFTGDTGPASPSSGPVPVQVVPQPFADSAKQIVAAAIRNAKNAKLDPKAGVFFVINTAGDPFLNDRALAIRQALEAAGIHSIQEVHFAKDPQVGQKVLSEHVKAAPKPAMIFAFDFPSSAASNGAAGEISNERPMVLGGYTSEDSQLRMARAGEFAALGHYVPTRLVRKAIATAVAIALKQEVHDRVEVPVVVHESPPDAGTPHIQAQYKAAQKPKEPKP